MFDVGKKIYYKNVAYQATIGTILSKKVLKNSIYLKVLSPDGTIQRIEKRYPENIKTVEENYLRYGFY